MDAAGKTTSKAQERAFPLVVWLTAVGLTACVGWWSINKLGVSPDVPWRAFPDAPLLDGLARWDSYWYHSIADVGYGFELGGRSNYAFFPGFGVAMWAVGSFVGSLYLGGIIVAAVFGVLSLYLFRAWLRRFPSVDANRSSLVALAFGPSAFYLAGVAYSESMFLASALAAFLFVEKERPIAAAIAAWPALVTRPVGVALVVGLVVRSFEIQKAESVADTHWPWRPWLHSPNRWLLLSVLGVVTYPVFLYFTAGDALLFLSAGQGWGHGLDLAAVLKIQSFEKAIEFPLYGVVAGIQVVTMLLAVAALPTIRRLFGLGYVVFTVVAIGIPALLRPEVIGMGRYVLIAFPVVGAVAVALRRDAPRVRWLVLGASLVLFAFQFSLFSRWHFVG